MVVIVAEKPSVARDIARVLGCGERGEGYLKNDRYTVTWAVGHLITLVEPDELDEKYKKWRMDSLPILPEVIPTKVIAKTRSQFSVIKGLINDKDTERLICATDAGREGELIFRLIYQKAKCTKPFDRLWISSMTDEAIREGFRNLKPSSDYDGLYRSAECRSYADWLIGMNASRAFTIRFNALLSIGRVQTPTLAILVKRYHEIKNFVPREYYTLRVDYPDFYGMWFDSSVEDERKNNWIETQEKAKEIAAKLKGKTAAVDLVTSEDKREAAPQLYDLTSLQRDANKKLGFTADKTLKTAQELYEKWKAVTYPRTDSRYLSDDMIPTVKTTLNMLPAEYQNAVQGIPYTRQGSVPVSKRVFDNTKLTDHHAIIPTAKRTDISKLPQDEAALFDMIAKRFIAAFYPPYEYTSTKVITSCEGEHFKSTGKTVKAIGWRALYPEDDKGEDILPKLAKGDTRAIIKTTVKKESTKPPAEHTDASLLYAMENAGRDLEDEALREQMKGSGLGTPATRAAIIERLIQVGYASRKGKIIRATEKGVQLIAIAPDEIASPETTGKWELALDEIAHNRRDTQRFMQGIHRLAGFLVQYAQDTKAEAAFEPEKGRKGSGKSRHRSVIQGCACPLCGKGVIENEKAFGCAAWQSGCRFTVWKDALTRGGGPVITEKLITLILEKHEVKGSTGTIELKDQVLSFTPNEHQDPSVSVSIVYNKKGK